MGRMYAVTFSGATIGVVQDLWQVAAGTNVALVIHSIYLGRRDLTANDQMRILIHRGTGSVVNSGGTAVPLGISAQAMDATFEVNDATQLTDGVILHSDAFSVLDGWIYLPPPEDRILVSGAGQLAISSDIAVTSGTWDGTCIVEELG